MVLHTLNNNKGTQTEARSCSAMLVNSHAVLSDSETESPKTCFVCQLTQFGSTHPKHSYPNPHVLISDEIFGGLHDLDLVLA